ncbi:MAG: hypothetical protein ACKVRP_08655 [Bacteroidota bacterium]
MKTKFWKKSALFTAMVFCLGITVLLFFFSMIVDGFIKKQIIGKLESSYPEYTFDIASLRFNVWENRIVAEGVSVTGHDPALSGSVQTISIGGIHWLRFLWKGDETPDPFADVAVEGEGILLNFPDSLYELRCKTLNVSLPDSQVSVKGFEVQPAGSDTAFFAASPFRQTRFRFTVAEGGMVGIGFKEIFGGSAYRARSLSFSDVAIDILINKEKRSDKTSPPPLMPNDVFPLIKDIIQLDSLNISGATLKYGERFSAKAAPAVLAWENVQLAVEGISTQGDTIFIKAGGEFMKGGVMNLRMEIPVGPEFSFNYSGSLSGMPLVNLNPWLVISDHTRIKSGVLIDAALDIRLVKGRATGSVRAVYRNLSIALLDGNTRSENDIEELLSSFIANTFAIRQNNVPDDSGALKVGVVNYTRTRKDAFFTVVWFALRSGLGDVVGF